MTLGLRTAYEKIMRATLGKLPGDYSIKIVVDASIDKTIKEEGRLASIDDALDHYLFIEEPKGEAKDGHERERRMNSEGTYVVCRGTKPECAGGITKWQYTIESLSQDQSLNLMGLISQISKDVPGYVLPETNMRNNSGYTGSMEPRLKSKQNKKYQ